MNDKDVSKKSQEPEKKQEPSLVREISGVDRSFWQTILIPLLAVFTGLVIGAIVIVVTDATVVAAYGNFFRAPGAALKATWDAVAIAYGSLFAGSLGSPAEIINAIQIYFASGNSEPLLKAIYPFTESLVTSTPSIQTAVKSGGLLWISTSASKLMLTRPTLKYFLK